MQHEAFAHRHGKGIGGQQCAVFIDGRQKNPVMGFLVSEGQREWSVAGVERGERRLQTIAGQLRSDQRAFIDRYIANDGRKRGAFGVDTLNRDTARGHELPTRALRAHRIGTTGAAARTDHSGIGGRIGGDGEKRLAGGGKRVIGRGGMISGGEGGAVLGHTHGEGVAIDFLRGGRADKTTGGDVAQAEGEGAARRVEGRGVHEFPRIVAVVELCGMGEFGGARLVGEHRALESVDGVAQQVNLSGLGKRSGGLHRGFRDVGHFLSTDKEPKTTVAAGRIGIEVHGLALSGQRSVEPQAVVGRGANGVVAIAVGGAVAFVAEYEVVVLGRSIVVPTSGDGSGRGLRGDTAFGSGFRHEGETTGVVAVLLETPELRVGSGRAFGGLRCRPKSIGGSAFRFVLRDERRIGGEQRDAAAFAIVVGGARHEAVVGIVVGRAHFGINHRSGLFVAKEGTVVLILIVIEHHGVGLHAAHEAAEVLFGLRRPTGFGDGNEARKGQVLHHVGCSHVFGPECALHTDRVFEVSGLFFVSGFQVVGAVAGQRGHPACFRGGTVDVIGAVDGVDAGESELVGDLGTATCGHPAIDRGAGFLHELKVGAFLGHGFVPNGDLATFRPKVGADFVDEVGLQLAIRRELQALVHLLALLVVLPCRGGAFVTADVDVLRGENVHQFVEDVLHKAHGFGVGHVEHVGEHPTPRFHAVRAARIAGELRVGGHGSREVAGHVDLGNHLDVAFGGVGDDVFQLSTRVEVGAVGTIRPVSAVLHGGDVGVGRHGTDRGQPRIFFHFPTPTLVFGEVEVELVEFVHRHEVEHAFDLVDAEKVAGHVEHEAAIGEARAVGDSQAGQFIARDGHIVHTGGDTGGQHLV